VVVAAGNVVVATGVVVVAAGVVVVAAGVVVVAAGVGVVGGEGRTGRKTLKVRATREVLFRAMSLNTTWRGTDEGLLPVVMCAVKLSAQARTLLAKTTGKYWGFAGLRYNILS
jgi:hypothetical protein